MPYNYFDLTEHQLSLLTESIIKGKNINWKTGEGISWMRLSKEEVTLMEEVDYENK